MAEYSWLVDDIETLKTYTKDYYTKAVLNQAVKAIRKLSADVVPVRHGRWVKPTRVPDSMLDECSLCGFDCGAYTFNYCPNCGAKMDGGET